MSRLSETLSIVIGSIGMLPLIFSIFTPFLGGFERSDVIFLVYFHFTFVIMAIPAVLTAVFNTNEIGTKFRNIIIIISVVNTILIIAATVLVSRNFVTFIIIAIFELMPILLLYMRRDTIVQENVASST